MTQYIDSLGHKQEAQGVVLVDPATNKVIGTAGAAAGMPVSGQETVFDVTLSLDTSPYNDGDVLADTQAVTGFFPAAGGSRVLQNIIVLDEDDQGVGFDLIFLDSNVSLGTENSAPSITDANGRSIIGKVSISAGDFIDLGGCRIADITPIGKTLKAAAGSTTLYVGAITRSGTPTYTASGLRVKLGGI